VAGAGLTGPDRDPAALAAVAAVDAWVARFAAALTGPGPSRAAIVAEVEDGLRSAVAAKVAGGLVPSAAAGLAIAEFGEPGQVAAGFGPELAAASARRVGLGLLLTGPLVGSTWLALLALDVAGSGRPLQLGIAPALLALVLAVAVPAAVVSVGLTGRLARWLPAGPRLAPATATVAASACVLADAGLLAGLLAWSLRPGPAPALAPAALACAASLTRLTLAGLAARRCLSARTALR
jgi:hypothetical protein